MRYSIIFICIITSTLFLNCNEKLESEKVESTKRNRKKKEKPEISLIEYTKPEPAKITPK